MSTLYIYISYISVPKLFNCMYKLYLTNTQYGLVLVYDAFFFDLNMIYMIYMKV